MTKLISILLAAAISTAAAGGVQQSEVTLEGKSIAFIGDSISNGANWKGGYGKLIGEQSNMTVTNPSIDGATLARNVIVEGAVRSCIIDMTDKLTDSYDYIIVEGGINDYWNHVELGALTDGFNGGYDELTITGALESIFSRLKKDHPESKVGFVIIHNLFRDGGDEGFKPYYERFKKVCDKWDVPYLDLYTANNTETGVNVKDAEAKKLYFGSESKPEGDGIHPNEAGYRKIYAEPMVLWLRTL